METSGRKIPSLLGLVLVTVTTACGAGGSDDALVGTWKRMRDNTTEVRDQYTFGVDGAFAFDENKPTEPTTEDHMTGTYVASNGIVVASATNALDGERGRLTFSYYAGETEFSSAALLPEGAHTGIVGAWKSTVKIELLDRPGETPEGATTTLEFRNDGTFQATTTPHDGSTPIVQDGTWVTEPDDIFRLTPAGDPATSPSMARILKLVDGVIVDTVRIWHRS
jgi:hypothetical protein